MIFYKTVTCGNDFLHVNMEDYISCGVNRLPKGELTRLLCLRQEGAGADGVVFYTLHNDTQVTDFEIFNRDGSEAELSGNGMAGLSALLFHLNRHTNNQVILDTKVGIRKHFLQKTNKNVFRIKVEIGSPDFSNRYFFPFLEEGRLNYSFKDIVFYPVSVGNPHVVVFTDTLPEKWARELEQTGKQLEFADIFPFKTNVEFISSGLVESQSKDSETAFQVYYYERGVGPTISSSTGSSAAFAVLRKLDLINDSLILTFPGQAEKLKISGKNEIYIESCTEIVYKGMYLGI